VRSPYASFPRAIFFPFHLGKPPSEKPRRPGIFFFSPLDRCARPGLLPALGPVFRNGPNVSSFFFLTGQDSPPWVGILFFAADCAGLYCSRTEFPDFVIEDPSLFAGQSRRRFFSPLAPEGWGQRFFPRPALSGDLGGRERGPTSCQRSATAGAIAFLAFSLMPAQDPLR